MNRITSDISRLRKTGETKFHETFKISKEEIAKHVHPRHKRLKRPISTPDSDHSVPVEIEMAKSLPALMRPAADPKGRAQKV